MSLCNNFWDNDNGLFIDYQQKEWMLPNQIAFNDWVNKNFQKFKLSDAIVTDSVQGEEAFPHQLFIKEFLSPGSPYRGLYVYHGLGSGKTRTSIIMSEQFRALGHKIVFISPAALSVNMIEELSKWGNSDIRAITDPKERKKFLKKHYQFVSINGTPHRKFTSIDLENKIVIIDEVHNLGSLMANKKNKKAKKFYEWLMLVKNCKILALSGSPIINEPFELSLVCNILRGPMDYETSLVDERVIRNYKSVFPYDKKEFAKLFIDFDKNTLNNELIFKRRITGLFSYFYGIVGTQLPDLSVIEEKVFMSDYQYKYYKIARDYEVSVDKFSSVGDDDDSISSYRNYSRQFSNIIPPEPSEENMVIYRFIINEKFEDWDEEQQQFLRENFENDEDYNAFVDSYKNVDSTEERIDLLKDFQNASKFISAYKVNKNNNIDVLRSISSQRGFYSQEFLQNLSVYSPKILKLLENITNGPGNNGKVFVYSHYRNISGIESIKQTLKLYGYEEINEDNLMNFNPDTMTAMPRYGFFVGGMDNDTRYKIKQIYNHSRNIHGEIMKVFMGTQAAAEGISLKEVQQVHILEPYWNNVRIKQVIGRARRLGSHANLPQNEQTVYTFKYFTVFSETQTKIEENTTDIHIHTNALKKESLNDRFLNAVKSSAVDCSLNLPQNSLVDKDYQCYVPDPDSTKEKVSWYSNIQDDINRLGGIEYKKSIEINKFLSFPRPHHINILKLYHEELYEPKNTFFSGTVKSVEDNVITFNSKMEIIKIDGYFKDYYIHFFTPNQQGRIVNSYDYNNMKLTITQGADDSIVAGTRFWIYRPKYIVKILNNEIYKEDNYFVLYDRNYLLTEKKWVERGSVKLSDNERDAVLVSV